MLLENKKDKPFVLYEGEGEDNNVSEDMMANFKLMEIYNGQR